MLAAFFALVFGFFLKIWGLFGVLLYVRGYRGVSYSSLQHLDIYMEVEVSEEEHGHLSLLDK